MSLIIKIDEIKTEKHLGKAISYIMNEEKAKGLSLSNSGISPEQITETFFLTKQLHPSRGNRQAYHYKFSFSKDEKIKAEDALKFIQEWVEEYLGDGFDYVYSVHQDREHMHMHLIFNSVCRDGGKFRHNNGDWNRIIRPLTNRIAIKYNTGLLKDKNPSLDYSKDYEQKKDGFSWKEKVQRDVDECISQSKSYREFKENMVIKFQYQLREGVSQEHGLYLSLTPQGKAKAIRTYRLDEGYMPVDIERKIAGTYEKKENRYYAKRLDWATSRNYTFIPYKELSEYQKQMVRKSLDARRMYARTGTSLQMHEQSVRAIRKMTKEGKRYGTVYKRKRESEWMRGEQSQERKQRENGRKKQERDYSKH